MFEIVSEAISLLRTEAAGYSEYVRIWMKVMSISFFIGIAFSFHHRRALWIVCIMLLTALALVSAKIGWPDISRGTSGAVIHVVLWPIALLGLWRGAIELGRSASRMRQLFNIWRLWVTALILISLVLDIQALVTLL